MAIRAPIETELGRPSTALFAWVDERPLGSASLAQVHCPTTRDGRDVVVDGLEPGVRDLVLADPTLVRGLGRILDWLAPHYQPVATIKGLRAYTIRELDLAVEADNGETFAAPFHDIPAIVFPRMYRELSGVNVPTMGYPDGFKPGDPATFASDETQREQVVRLDAQAILQMLYHDGFFHADPCAGHPLILPGPPSRGRLAAGRRPVAEGWSARCPKRL